MINQNLLLTGDDGYNLTNSLRFRASASAYLNRTLGSSGSLRAWTWSAWVKRGTLSAQQDLFGWVDLSGGNFQQVIGFNSDNTLEFQMYNSALGGYVNRKTTSQVFRDPSAWYHIVVVWDSNNATANDRAIIYINGSRVTAWANNTNPSLNQDSYINNSSYPLGIARCMPSSSNYFDGYLTEINFVNAQALTPSSFGETSATTGVWIPKKYTGTYGTNGFYLPFTDNSALTTSSNAGLGKDFSGNANYWTTNNISITSGSTYDSMTDVPTLTSATTANYCVMNPLRIQNVNIAAGTLSDGNLKITTSASDNAYSNHYGTMAFPTTGKWYFEAVFAGAFGNDAGNYAGITGVSNGSAACTIVVTSTTAIQKNFSNVQTGLSFAVGDILGVAFDATNLTVDFYKNGSAFGSQVTGLDSVEYTPFILASNPANTQSSWTLNFGQQPFAYTPPTGFKALNTFNLPTPTIGATASTQAGKYFNTVLYTGNGSSQTVTGFGFNPDMVWHKGRSVAYSHSLVDVIRGNSNILFSNTTDAESNPGAQLDLATDGATVTYRSANLANNENAATYVIWGWKANGSGSTNTAGTITSTVSANTSAGFSIVTYISNGVNGATVGHGLGVAPKMVIVKCRFTGTTQAWAVYHAATGATQYLLLNSTAAAASSSTYWNDTAPSSTVFTIGTSNDVNINSSVYTYVAYCFAEVAGYSAFGSYTGNGSSDGPFIFTGFRPRYLMIKRTDSSNNWVIQDTSRDTYNVSEKDLYADTSGAETTYAAEKTDILSNGFKQRQTGASMNASGGTYIYMAFAENPFKYANAR